MKTKMLGALCLAALAVGALVLRAQPFQYQVNYTGPAVLLAADDHAERLLPGTPASRALDLSVWQEERIAAVREGQRYELADIAVDYALTPAERRARCAEVVKAKGGEVLDLLTVGQRETLASWVEKERERVDMILGENLVERLQPFGWLSAQLGLTDEQLAQVATIREIQRVDIGLINALTDRDPDDIRDRMNAMFLWHGEAVRALLTPSQVAQLDAMWSEVF
ncbi:MAG: hypothetical protein RLZZ188_1152 [Verrucomicrobiota bacterium]|jgi:hypothetical protein